MHSHMAHIKQTGLLSRPFVTLDVAQVGILQRHGIPRERDHFALVLNMKVIKLRPLDVRFSCRGTGGISQP